MFNKYLLADYYGSLKRNYAVWKVYYVLKYVSMIYNNNK